MKPSGGPRLLLVRHGQACFGTDHYDRLSPLGRYQSEVLAEHLTRSPAPAALYSGSLQRQQETAGILAERVAMPSPVPTMPAFDEYDIAGVFWAYLDEVLAGRPDLAPYRDRLNDNPAVFEQVYAAVMHAWLDDTDPAARGLAAWSDFQCRLTDGLAALAHRHGGDETVLVVTSGGVIASAAGYALDLDPRTVLRLNRRLHNASLTLLEATDRGWDLVFLNAVEYLRQRDPALLTHR